MEVAYIETLLAPCSYGFVRIFVAEINYKAKLIVHHILQTYDFPPGVAWDL